MAADKVFRDFSQNICCLNEGNKEKAVGDYQEMLEEGDPNPCYGGEPF